MDDRNIVLTGIPRSGSTLLCHLLNEIPKTVALHEPIVPPDLREGALPMVEEFFHSARKSLNEYGTAPSKHIDGKVPDNNFSNQHTPSGKRVEALSKGVAHIYFGEKTDKNFRLCVKQNAFFTCIIEQLAEVFPCYAIIRNPLSVLGSWNSVNLPVSRGHIPAAERLDAKLKQNLASIDSVLERQVYILNWFFQQFSRHIAQKNILRYEEIVQSGGQCLSVINPDASALHKNLQSKNNSRLYAQDRLEVFAERLLQDPNHACWQYYRTADIENLLS